MIEKIEKAIEEMIAKTCQCNCDSGDAVRYSQAAVNLANAKACLIQSRINEEAAK